MTQTTTTPSTIQRAPVKVADGFSAWMQIHSEPGKRAHLITAVVKKGDTLVERKEWTLSGHADQDNSTYKVATVWCKHVAALHAEG